MPVAKNAPAPVREYVLRPGEPLDLHGEPPPFLNSPVLRFARVYTDDVFALMGAYAMSWRSGKLDELKLRFDTLEHAWMADVALKDTVLGARLVFADRDGNPYDTSTFTGNYQNVARNIATIPGVVRVNRTADSAVAYTDSTATRVRLEQLTAAKWGPLQGLWAGHCYGKTCPVDPPPPTGEWPGRDK